MQNVDKDVEKLEHSYIAGRNEKLYNHFEMLFGIVLQILNTHLSCDLIMLLLGISPREKPFARKILGALFIVIKTWKQDKRPSTRDCFKIIAKCLLNSLLFSNRKQIYYES